MHTFLVLFGTHSLAFIAGVVLTVIYRVKATAKIKEEASKL